MLVDGTLVGLAVGCVVGIAVVGPGVGDMVGEAVHEHIETLDSQKRTISRQHMYTCTHIREGLDVGLGLGDDVGAETY